MLYMPMQSKIHFKILICDDDEIFRLTVGERLLSLGYEVDTVSSAEDAISSTTTTNYDLAILDIELPDIKGTDLSKLLAPLPILFITQHGETHYIDNVLSDPLVAAYSAGYIVKPVDLDRVESDIRVALGISRYKKANKELIVSSALAVEREKRLLARDLHDVLGGQLTLLRIELAALKAEHDVSGFTDSSERVKRITQGVDNIYSLVKQVITDLLPEDIQTLGIKGAIETLVETWSAKMEETEIFLTGSIDILSKQKEELQVAVYRIIQETINNAAKYSHAKTIKISISPSGLGENGFKIEYHDDGDGFNINTIPPGHYGISGMQERVVAFGGVMEIVTAIGEGVHYSVTFPSQLP